MFSERTASRDNQSGFTLVELMIVLAIIGILAATLLPNFQHQVQGAHVAAAISDMKCLQTALTTYALKNPDTTIPPTMGSYAEMAAISSANGCVMPPEGDPNDPSLPITPIKWWCTILIGGHIAVIPCDSLNPRPQGYDLFVHVQKVALDYPGSVVRLSSDRGIRTYTFNQAQQIINNPPI